MKKILFLCSILILSGCNTKKNIDGIIDDYVSTVELAARTPRFGMANVILKLQTIRMAFREQAFYFSCKNVQKDIINQMYIIEEDLSNFLSNTHNVNNSAQALSNLVKLRKEKSCTSLDKIEEREITERIEERIQLEKLRKACDAGLINQLKQLTAPISSDFDASITDNTECSYEFRKDLISYKESLERIEKIDSSKLKKVLEDLIDLDNIKNDIENLETKTLKNLFKKHFKNVLKKVTVQTNRVFEVGDNIWNNECRADITIKNKTAFFVEGVALEQFDSSIPLYLNIYRENADREKIFGLAPNSEASFHIDAIHTYMDILKGDSLRKARKEIQSEKNITIKSMEWEFSKEGSYCLFPKKPIITEISLTNKVMSKAKIKNEYKYDKDHSLYTGDCLFDSINNSDKFSFSGECSAIYSKGNMNKDLMKEKDVAFLIRHLKEKTGNKIDITAELPIKLNKEISPSDSAKPTIKFNGIAFDDVYFYINKKELLEKIIEKYQKNLE